MIRPMRGNEEVDCRAIYAACHPGWPPRPPRWFEAHPTLVALDDGGEVIGYTSYSLSIPLNGESKGEVMVGYGIDVHPVHQGRGVGHLLTDARLALAREVGAVTFIGHAAPDNHAMIRLFERDGFKPFGEGTYPDGSRMLVYVGPVA